MTIRRTRRALQTHLKPGLLRALGAGAATGVAILGATAASADNPKTTPTAAALPTITISSPRDGGSYQRGSRIVARFRCGEDGVTTAITTCNGTVARGRAINTATDGRKNFTVSATDAGGTTHVKTVHYTVWAYVNPLQAVAGLQASRIDMGVDYSGSGPIRALGRAKVVVATDRLAGPESCWGKTCVPAPGDIIIYRLLDGPFAGKYVYVVENITITVKAGQTVRAGERIAILHPSSPNLEIGWASGHGVETLAVADGHQCSCVDPGGWSSIEGRDFDHLLVWLGAPAGYVTSAPPNQRMPRGWPGLPARATTGSIPGSPGARRR